MTATYLIIGINVALFVASVVGAPSALMGGDSPLHQRLDLIEYYVSQGESYRLLTSGFMHFGLIHIGFNMFLLFQLGRLIEPLTGSVKFSLLYFASLLGGSLGAVLLSGPFTQTAGASGAVFGLMGAAAVGQWLHGTNPINTPLGRLIFLNLAFTFFFPGISIGGHLGGLLTGVACGFVLLARRPDQVPSWAQYAVPVALMVVAFVAGIAFSTGQL